MGAQKNRLIVGVDLSTHSICFWFKDKLIMLLSWHKICESQSDDSHVCMFVVDWWVCKDKTKQTNKTYVCFCSVKYGHHVGIMIIVCRLYFGHLPPNNLFRLETPKTGILLKTVKTQVKCCIMRYIIRICTVDLQIKKYNIFWGGGQGGTQPPLPSPFHPTSLPLSPHFPPPLPPLPSPSNPTSLPLSDFSLPLIKFCSCSWT